MRLASCVCALSVALMACGDDGGSSTDAGVPDAALPDARSNDADNFVCDDSTSNSGFVPPTQIVQAYTQEPGGTWVLQGPADFSCLGSPNDVTPTTGELTLSGRIEDFQTGNPVPTAMVAVWPTSDTSGSPVATATADVNGLYSVTLPAGSQRPVLQVTAPDTLNTSNVNQVLPNQASHSINLWSISLLTANALPAFVGIARTPGLGSSSWTIVDCQGRRVANAIATVSSTSAVTDECTTHLIGASTFYFSAGSSTSLPVRHIQQSSTNRDGLFVVVELPPSTGYLQVWGYVSGQTPGSSEPGLLAEVPISIEADSFNMGTIQPLRAP